MAATTINHITPDELQAAVRPYAEQIAANRALLIEQGKQVGAVLERLAALEGKPPSNDPGPAPGPVPQPGPAPTPAPASAIRAAFIGNDPPDAEAHDEWIGEAGTPVLLFTEQRDWVASPDIGWWINRWLPTGRTVFWSIPLHPQNSSLADVVSGRWDPYWHRVAADLVAAYPTGDIHIRTGWEFNGSWFPWAAAGREAQYVAAFRRVAGVLRSVSDRIRVEWCPNIGTQRVNPELCYPGDDVVDVIGLDFYYRPVGHGRVEDGYSDPLDPIAAWNQMVAQQHGLQWHRDFALAHGKPVAFSEWGVMLDTSSPYIERFAAWIASSPTPVIYHAYWDSDASYTGKLSGGRWPAAGAVYRTAFGEQA